MPAPIRPEDGRLLVALARRTVESAARRIPPERVPAPHPMPPALLEKCGAFVTLHKSGELRGCIGTLTADDPLWEAVRDSAWSAAREDTRFAPLTEPELADLSVEVSVLSPLVEIPSWDGFIPGRHGIVIEKDKHRAVFLPKVAEEMGWDREQTLSALCRKAGLPANAWQLPGARFWIFTAEVFGELVGPEAES